MDIQQFFHCLKATLIFFIIALFFPYVVRENGLKLWKVLLLIKFGQKRLVQTRQFGLILQLRISSGGRWRIQREIKSIK